MSYAVNPSRLRKTTAETEVVAAARQQKCERERIRRLLITLGDDNKKVAGQIRGLAGALEDDVEMHGDLLAETVLECAKSLPLKTSIYASWVSRMAEKQPVWANTLLFPKLLEQLRGALRAGQATVAQLLLQFAVGLGNYGAVGLQSLCSLLHAVAGLSDGLRSSKGGDLGIYLALAALPFMSSAAQDKVTTHVDQLIGAGEGYLANRASSPWKPLLRILKTEDIPDKIEALPLVLRSLKASKWCSQCVLHLPGCEPTLHKKAGLEDLDSLDVTAEDIRKSKVRMQVPLMASRLLTSASDLDGADDSMSVHDRWVLEDYILLTIDMFGRDVDECAKQILKIPVLHPQFEAITIETVFSQLLRLPSPPWLPLFYSRLLEMITEKQASTRKLVEQSYGSLIARAQDLDEECLEVLAEAFAYHLMHNSYQTDWTLFAVDTVTVQAQRLVRRTLDRLQRLSFHQNLLHRLPETMHVYVPPEPLAPTTLPIQKTDEFRKMLGLVRIKEPDVQLVLDYCNGLQCNRTKREGVPSQLGQGTPPSTCGVGDAEPEPGSTEEGSTQAKRRRLGTHDMPEEVQGGETGTQHAHGENETTLAQSTKVEADSASAHSSPGPAAHVKQEIKQEEYQGAHNGGGQPKQAEAPTVESCKTHKKGDLGKDAGVLVEPCSHEQVVELFTAALLQNGAKTPTHMSKLLDGYQQVFSAMRPDDERAANDYTKLLVRCVVGFWKFSSQRLEITVDAMLQRGILTSRAVVEHTLAERGPQGCDSMAVWNILNSVARKSLERSQNVRVELAMAKRLGKGDVLDACKGELDSAIHETAELFTLIFTGLVRNCQDFEDTDSQLRHVMLQRILIIGRKYHAFIKPLVDAAEARIPGVAHNPDVAAVFRSLSAL